MLKRFLEKKSKIDRIIIASTSAIFLLFIIFVIWSIIKNAITQSDVIYVDEQNIEIVMGNTNAEAELDLTLGVQNIHIKQRAAQKLTLALDLPGIANVRIYNNDGDLLAERRAFLDEEINILPTHDINMYRVVVTPDHTLKSSLSRFMIRLESNRRNYAPIQEEPMIVFSSPTCLQLALFAHMAFFPFDFNSSVGPHGYGHDPFHYIKFYENIMTPNGQNNYGFSFNDQIKGWNLYDTYVDIATGFSVTIYVNDNGCRTVLAIRGSDGGVYEALTNQSGTWWCNFNALAGNPHSHIESLEAFLAQQLETLKDTRIYITGHSLGGFLAYKATHMLVEMGLEDNLRRVVAFGAPIFYTETTRMIAALAPDTRNRIMHYYVPGDRIARLVGIENPGEFPGYDSFHIISQLFETMRDVHGVDIPFTIEAISNLFSVIEILFPISLPDYVARVVWLLDGAFSLEALELSQEFYELILHVPVEQTWHSPRPDPDWPIRIDLLRDMLADIVFDMVDRIFDTDTHEMMNFYTLLSASYR